MALFFILLFLTTNQLYSNTYIVKKNDSLWDISKEHKISIADIVKLNDLSKKMIFEKQRLYIPNTFSNYTVSTGDTFQSIAQKFNTKIKYIITLNNISENHVIEGQKLRIPVSKTKTKLPPNTSKHPIKTIPVVYKVKRGDTLSDVALKYRTTVPKLRQLNNKNSSSIYIGERLIVGNKKVPSSSSLSGSKKIVHVVKYGETLGQIAINYGVSSQNILNWNDKNSSRIFVKEKLTIYATKNQQASSKNDKIKTIQYTVRRGDNLSYIAAKFGTSPSIIKKLNNKRSDKLLVGETLKITVKLVKNTAPASPKFKTKLIRYRVRRGDTLDDIAIKYKVRRSQLLSWNNKRSTRIYIGESLKVYVPIVNSNQPKQSKKAEYIKRNSTGITSRKFKNISLPVKYSNILSATTSGRGIDLILNKKTNIESPSKATVQHAGYIKALQNVVILQLDNDRTIVYAGLDRLNVKTGQEINSGYLLGSTGINSIDKKPKLYIEMRDKNKVVNILNSYKELKKKQK